MERAQTARIVRDLDKKMVVLIGPRQAGKTWLAKSLLPRFPNGISLNYDEINHRSIIMAKDWHPATEFLILDELHKMPDWKNYLKGLYDTREPHLRILITGSASLEIYNQLGDSLAGRYFSHRLLPLSVAELKQVGEKHNIEHLLTRSGFPEPYLSPDLVEASRWRLQYINSLLTTDVFDVEPIQNIKALRLLFALLRNRVGSSISYQSLALDIQVSPTTIKKYIAILEALFVIFRVTPYSKNISRSLLKEPKIYFFDIGLVENKAARLENLVALSLLKSNYGMYDYLAKECSLHYLRTKEGKEVDFALVEGDKIHQIIEVKTQDSNISPSLRYFSDKYHLPGVQVVQYLQHERLQGNIEVLKLERFLEDLYL